jgi:hypothetical protein
MSAIPKGHTAVMAQRVEPPDSLDFFPTPPWATRALMECMISKGHSARLARETCWEPACGEGHMAEVLKEYFATVYASDVHDYGRGYRVGSFIGDGIDVLHMPYDAAPDWTITNPPFNLAVEFAKKAVNTSRRGAGLLLRSNWMEGGERYREVFNGMPPTTVAIFAERVPMAKGRWDPDGSTATSYAWFVWEHRIGGGTRLMWIPPGQRQRLERPDDRRRFAAKPQPMTLFPEGATP